MNNKHEFSPKYTLFKVIKSRDTKHYFVSTNCKLGEGGSSTVYKGYACVLKDDNKKVKLVSHVTEEDVLINKNYPVAIKFYRSESRFFRNYDDFNTLGVLFSKKKAIQIMKYIGGVHIILDPLAKSDNHDIDKMTFFQAVDASCQLIHLLNELHHRKKVHGDIKDDNIKFIKKISATGEESWDVHLLDYEYSKPITHHEQTPQGTPMFVAPEVLDGMYSEYSDFYALTPLLLYLFGASDPLKNFFLFREKHSSIAENQLAIHYAHNHFNYCPDDIFKKFIIKENEEVIYQLLKKFIMGMGEYEKENRPAPDAILEFFTALRQWCLVSEQKDQETYLLRMKISSGHAWMHHRSNINKFIRFSEDLQIRLLEFINLEDQLFLYQKLMKKDVNPNVLAKMRDNFIDEFHAKIAAMKPPSALSSFFFNSIKDDLSWFVNCIKKKEWDVLFAAENHKKRLRILNYVDSDSAEIITTIIDACRRLETDGIKNVLV